MLKATYISYAMQNNTPEIKSVAKYLTVSNINDGVGKAILTELSQ